MTTLAGNLSGVILPYSGLGYLMSGGVNSILRTLSGTSGYIDSELA